MTVSEGVLRDMLRLVIWYPVRWVINILPVRLGFGFINFLGTLDYNLRVRKKRGLKKNIAEVFGGKDDAWLSDVAREYVKNHYVNQLQIILFPKMDPGNIEKVHTFEGIERLDQALAEGKGCILLHPHFGPAQLPLHILGVKGYKVMQVGYLTDEGLSFIGKKVAFRLRVRLEAKIKARIIQADRFLRPLFEWLKDGGVLMMTGDGAGGGKLIGKFRPFPFLNGSYLFPVGAATLAAKTGAPILPAFVTLDGGRYKTCIEPPIHVKNDEEDIQRATACFVATFERYINDNPGFWHFWDELRTRRAQGQ